MEAHNVFLLTLHNPRAHRKVQTGTALHQLFTSCITCLPQGSFGVTEWDLDVLLSLIFHHCSEAFDNTWHQDSDIALFAITDILWNDSSVTSYFSRKNAAYQYYKLNAQCFHTCTSRCLLFQTLKVACLKSTQYAFLLSLHPPFF